MKITARAFEEISAYFAIMAEPTRLRIVHSICDSERSVNEIVEEVGATQTNVSRHLSIMYRSHILSRRKEGNQVFYRLSDPIFMQICRGVCSALMERLHDGEPLRKDLQKLIPAKRRTA
jgi:DNA-binding transcriptional ArsR family regulator